MTVSRVRWQLDEIDDSKMSHMTVVEFKTVCTFRWQLVESDVCSRVKWQLEELDDS